MNSNRHFSSDFIDFRVTGLFSNLITNYLSGEENLKKFYSHNLDIFAFEQAMAERNKNPVNREILVEALERQYHRMSGFNDPELSSRLKRLGEKNTFTVTTGHQLCLFTGPLYFIYKIISAINLAEALKKQYPDCHFIPVYWMASEDHDLEEINKIHLFSHTVTWENQQSGACGRMSTEGLESFCSELAVVLGNSAGAARLQELFRKSYLEHANLADATRYLVHQLFGSKGLIVLDADDEELKKTFIPFVKSELEEQHSFRLVSENSRALASYAKIQVTPREINLFFLEGDRRERITKLENGDFGLHPSGIIFNRQQMMEVLDKHPGKFSPNVVLRPVYQETILPNLAYIGGPGEIAYWLQYKSLFDFYGIPFPVLMLRNCLTWLDKETSQKLDDLGFYPESVFKDQELLVREFLERNSTVNEEVNLEEHKDLLNKVYDSLKTETGRVDPTLSSFINAEQQKAINALQVLEQKILKALKKKNEVALNQVRAMKEKLFPGQIPQERHYNFAMFYLKYGEEFFEVLYQNLDPLRLKYIIIRENP